MPKTSYLISTDSISERYSVLGLMSGTSLDGLDICHAEFFRENSQWKFQILEYHTYPIPEKISKDINAFSSLDPEQIKNLSHEFGEFSGHSIISFLKEKNVTHIDLIGAHGHTLFHDPKAGITLQIGNGPEIRDLTGIETICDFRTADVALGGQGAPLVPIGDHELFYDFSACINIGGFANISFESRGKRIAYDLCAANFVMNRWAENIGLKYDDRGLLAESGNVITPLLNELNNLAYYSESPPKSLGREWIESVLQPIFQKYSTASTPDLLATFNQHIATIIADTIDQFDGPVLFTGGGVYNQFLMKNISKKTSTKVVIPPKNWIEQKEALIFGFLAVLRKRGEVNVLSSVTGAQKDHSSGVIWPAI